MAASYFFVLDSFALRIVGAALAVAVGNGARLARNHEKSDPNEVRGTPKIISEKLAQELFANGQVYRQYCTEDGKPTMLQPVLHSLARASVHAFPQHPHAPATGAVALISLDSSRINLKQKKASCFLRKP